MPLITVITACKNAKASILSCLESTTAQICTEVSVEHLIIDGASTDGTIEIIKEYQNRHPHIRLISEPDNGQSQALNKSIRHAKGTIIGLLNADDCYSLGTLLRASTIFKVQSDPTILVGNCRIADQKGQELGINKPNHLRLVDLLSGAPAPYNPCAYFYHRSLHQQIGFYDETDPYTMDLDFLLRAVQVANVVYVDRILGTFVWHPESKTFQLFEAGELEERCQQVRNRYIQRQSWLKRRHIALLKWRRQFSRKLKRLKNRFSNKTGVVDPS